MQRNKYFDVDKVISNQIMKEFKGKIIDSICSSCDGKGSFKHGSECENCNGIGHYKIQY